MKLVVATVLLGITAGPSPGQQSEVPDRSAAQALVKRIDDAFNSRDLRALLGCFEGENLQLMRVLAERMTPVLNGPVRLHRDSEISSYMDISRRGVALVKSTIELVDASNPVPLEEYSYLVMKREGDRAVGSFMVEVDLDLLDRTADNRFRCPACNYEVMGAPGWLAVPHRPERTQCMEAISFYYLGADLTLDLSVFVDPVPLKAMQTMGDYLASLFEQVGTPGDVEVRTWNPPYYKGDPPRGLDGASAELELPGHQLSRHYLATLGSLRYLLVLNGNAGAFASHNREADAILNGFRILDPSAPVSELVAMRMQTHASGSHLDETRFTSSTYGVSLEGPEGWMPSVRAGGYLFEVAYRCPLSRGALWATAHRPPPGLTAWYTRLANAWVKNHCREQGMEIRQDSGWSEPGGDFRFRDLETTPPKNSTGAANLPRMIRLAMSDDLLLVLHGYGQDQSDRDLVMASFNTLRRTR